MDQLLLSALHTLPHILSRSCGESLGSATRSSPGEGCFFFLLLFRIHRPLIIRSLVRVGETHTKDWYGDNETVAHAY